MRDPSVHHDESVHGVVPPEVRFHVVDAESSRARDLQNRQIAEMVQRYGGSGPAPLWGEEFAEIKRMYVDPAVRRRGVGARVLMFLEQRARASGYSETWLETGIEQPDAISLFEAAGYHPRPAYGEFKDDPRCRCYSRTLAAAGIR